MLADEVLNGGWAEPLWSNVNDRVATAPNDQRNGKPVAAAKSVVIAWLALFLLLVLANVLTISVQR